VVRCRHAAIDRAWSAVANEDDDMSRPVDPSINQPTLKDMTPALYVQLVRFEQWNADRWHRYCLRTNHLDARHFGEPLLVAAKRGYLLGVGAAAGETGLIACVGVGLVSTASAYNYSLKLLLPGILVLGLELALLTRFALTARTIGSFFRQAS
jgi:hypothetical protein